MLKNDTTGPQHLEEYEDLEEKFKKNANKQQKRELKRKDKQIELKEKEIAELKALLQLFKISKSRKM